MKKRIRSEKGISLIETAIALGVLSVGALGTAAVFVSGMERTKSSPGDLVATQKAQEAIESVFSARDSGVLTWSQMRNVSAGGIFVDGETNLNVAGADGLVQTADDGAVETVVYPGKDELLGTSDDTTVKMDGFKRRITIQNVTTDLRTITVELSYKSGMSTRTYRLQTYMSNRS